MADYYFDSSALIKRYVSEAGSAWVCGLFDPGLGHEAFIAEITPVEIVPRATVLAGTYYNVIRLTSVAKFSAGSSGTETHDILLVPGLGIIRDEMKSYGTTETRELLDGTIGGHSVRP